MPVLQIIVANTTTDHSGLPVAAWFGDRAREYGDFQVQIVDLAKTHLDGATVNTADAFVFVVPNADGANAAVNIVADSAELEWQHKPLGVIGYGDSSVVRAIESVVAPLALTRIKKSIAIDDVSERVDDGRLATTEEMDDSAKEMLDELWSLDPFFDALRSWAAAPELDRRPAMVG